MSGTISESASSEATSSASQPSVAYLSTTEISREQRANKLLNWRRRLMSAPGAARDGGSSRQEARSSTQTMSTPPWDEDDISQHWKPIHAPSATQLTRTSMRQPSRRSVGLFHVEARFEGRVLEVQNDVIITHLSSRYDRSEEFLTVEIPMHDIPPNDRKLAIPGATFYWLIGYEEKPYWKRSLILSFAGYKRLGTEQIAARERELMDFLKDAQDEMKRT